MILLCVAITRDNRKGKYEKLAQANEWLPVKFKSLPDCIINLKSQLDSVIKNGIAEDDPIYKALRNHITHARLNSKKLARMPYIPMDKLESTRPG